MAAVQQGGGRRRHIIVKGAPAKVGEWVKRRGPEPWHLVELGADRSVACGTPDVHGVDAVTWTDPDRYPPDSERCPPCHSIFSGATSAMSSAPRSRSRMLP